MTEQEVASMTEQEVASMRLRLLLVQHRMTLVELSKRSGVSRATIYNWLAGQDVMLSSVQRIAGVFGMATFQLLETLEQKVTV